MSFFNDFVYKVTFKGKQGQTFNHEVTSRADKATWTVPL